MNINFQSIVRKVPDFHCLLGTEKPARCCDWHDISNNEIFPSGYTLYRAHRRATTRSVGVFIVVRDNIVCTEQPQLQTDCELI